MLFPFDVPETGLTEDDEEDTSAIIEDLAGSSTDEDEAVAEDAQWEGAVDTGDTDEVRCHGGTQLL